MMKLLTRMLLGALILFSFWSCRNPYGFGVVLWSSNEMELPIGAVVRIVGESHRREIFRVEHPQNGSIVEIDRWRLEQFPRKQQAQEYLVGFAPFLRTYVEVRRAALPMREGPAVSNRIIYSLRNGQALKVLGRSAEREQIGGYMAYWYHALTNDGTQGWVYGRFLREYMLTESGQAIFDERDFTGDAILENFFDPRHTWRPTFIHNMVQRGEVNLALVREEYGLFINPERRVISIRLPNQSVDFTYSRITPVGGNAYMFVDSPFSFTLRPNNTVQARFALQGVNHTVEFRTMDTEIREIITNEELRRARLYRDFVENGPTFRGDLGTLTFTGGNNEFMFNDFQLLQQMQILLPSDGHTGRVVFDLFLADQLRTEYTGAFSLIFHSSGKRVTFVYRMGIGGFEATMVDFVTENRIVERAHLSGVSAIFAQ